MKNQFQINQLQLGVFLSSIDVSSRLKIATSVIETIPGLKNVDPVILPNNVAQGLPFVVIQNEQTGWGFQISPARMDFLYTPLSSVKYTELEFTISEFRELSIKLWDRLQTLHSARASRLGIVLNFGMANDNARTDFRKTFLKNKFGEDAKELQLHVLKTQIASDFEVNHWVRIISADLGMDMIMDINTIPDKPIEDFQSKTISDFLSLVITLVDESFTLYIGK